MTQRNINLKGKKQCYLRQYVDEHTYSKKGMSEKILF